VRAGIASADGVAVGRGAGDARDALGAAGAGDVLDQDGLAKHGLHVLGENARQGVGRSAGRIRRDDRQ
jgi:hypothetical protein